VADEENLSPVTAEYAFFQNVEEHCKLNYESGFNKLESISITHTMLCYNKSKRGLTQ
jgi:hypothetical protein